MTWLELPRALRDYDGKRKAHVSEHIPTQLLWVSLAYVGGL